VDNLRVPQGASCTLNDTKVQGTLKVENGARLVANGVQVVGNVQSEGFQSITLREGSRVGGEGYPEILSNISTRFASSMSGTSTP